MASSPQPAPFATESTADLFDVNGSRVLFEDTTENDRYTRIWDWTWCIKLTPEARTLYSYLRYRAGSNTKSWPERTVLSEVLLISERKVHDFLHELEDNGLIEIISRRKECKPSEYFIKSKASVSDRQKVLQNLQDPKPLAKSATTSRKSCKNQLQNPQLDIKTVDTHPADTSADTNGIRGASAPTPPQLTIVDDPFTEINDLPEWDVAGESLAIAHNDKPHPIQEQAIADAAPPPVEAPTPKTRKRALRYAAPDVYAAAQTIKAAYVTLTDLEPNKYADSDCEKLARACASVDEAIAVMHATYNETWRDGTQPNRKLLKLSKVLNMVPAYRRGDLAPTKTAPAATTGRKPAYQGLGGGGDGRRAWKPCCPLCGAEVGMPHNTKDPLKIGVRCEPRVVTDADLKRAGEVAS